MKTIGVFYGSSTGNTELAAEMICDQLGQFVSHSADISKSEPTDLLAYDILLLGVSTWNIGEMQDDWDDFLPRMEGLDLTGKQVGFFGMGDAIGYSYNFLDAMGMLWDAVKPLGSPTLVGVWPNEDYTFDESLAVYDDGHFVGVGLDEDNEPELHEERIKGWLMKIMMDCELIPSA